MAIDRGLVCESLAEPHGRDGVVPKAGGIADTDRDALTCVPPALSGSYWRADCPGAMMVAVASGIRFTELVSA